MLRTGWLLLLLLLVLSAPVAHGAVPIQDFVNVPVPAKIDGSPHTVAEVRNAIVTSCAARGWTAVDGPGTSIRASILVRGKHYAEIDIPYSSTSYSITYRSSRNLDYNEAKKKIHRNYHRWVVKLSGTIQKQLGVRSQVY